jgi:hypothetical protein
MSISKKSGKISAAKRMAWRKHRRQRNGMAAAKKKVAKAGGVSAKSEASIESQQ